MKSVRAILRIPTVGEYVRGLGRLIRIDKVPLPNPPPPPDSEYVFEEITACKQLRLCATGEVLKEWDQYWDFEGLEDSVKTAVEEAKAFAAKRGLGPNSELEVVAVKKAELIRKRATSSENNYDKEVARFEALEWGCKRDLPNPVLTIAWSSKTGGAK